MEDAVLGHRFRKNYMRTNISEHIKTYGKTKFIKPGHGVLSNTLKSGPILDFCKEALGPHINNVCLNKNVTCKAHRDSKNTGLSWVYFWGLSGRGTLSRRWPRFCRERRMAWTYGREANPTLESSAYRDQILRCRVRVT